MTQLVAILSMGLESPSQRPPESLPRCPPPRADLDLVRDVLQSRSGSSEALVGRLRCLARFMAALNARAGRPFDTHELSDLVQDSLLVVWRKLDRFRGPDGLESWVLKIARFEFQNALRKKARRSTVVGDLAEGFDVAAPGDEAERVLARHTLDQVMESLEPEAARTVHLKHYEGLTFEEIGARMQCSANTAKTRYYRSISRLAAELDSLNP